MLESEERRNAQEALARIQERAALALQSVADGVIIADVRGRVALAHDNAHRFEPGGHVGPPGVRSADGVPEVGQQFGDAAHADSTDTDEMDAARPTQHGAPPVRGSGRR